MAVETLAAQPAREMAEAKDQNEMDNPLREFGTCAVALRNVLYQDRALNEVEFLFIENHFRVIDSPALTGGVLSEFKLRLSRVFLTLLGYISANDLFCDTHRGHKVTL
jgi:hypothetical protein